MKSKSNSKISPAFLIVIIILLGSTFLYINLVNSQDNNDGWDDDWDPDGEDDDDFTETEDPLVEFNSLFGSSIIWGEYYGVWSYKLVQTSSNSEAYLDSEEFRKYESCIIKLRIFYTSRAAISQYIIRPLNADIEYSFPVNSITLNQWHTLEIHVDLKTETYKFILNGNIEKTGTPAETRIPISSMQIRAQQGDYDLYFKIIEITGTEWKF